MSDEVTAISNQQSAFSIQHSVKEAADLPVPTFLVLKPAQNTKHLAWKRKRWCRSKASLTKTRSLLQAVKRNSERFPSDFVFQLTRKESDSLRSQIVISKGRGGRRYLPYAFTEHGAIMTANVLNSKTAVKASVQVVRAFIRLRQILASNAELAHKLSEMERKYDAQFKVVFDAIRELMTPPEPKRKQIGFAKTTK